MKFFKTTFLICLGIFLIPALCYAWRGKVVQVPAGDRLIVERDGKEEEVRLYAIDCPEPGQPFWKEARQLTRFMVLDQWVEVIPVGQSAMRTYALVRLERARELINKRLVSYGMAWVKDRYGQRGLVEQWKEIEKMARFNEVGLWADPDPVPPWQWRRRGFKKPQPDPD